MTRSTDQETKDERTSSRRLAQALGKLIALVLVVVLVILIERYCVPRPEPFGPGANIVSIDGDTLRAGDGAEYRLFGIDAPELHQTCRRDERPWNCGSEAARALRTTIGGRDVNCRAREQDRYGRTVAVCYVGGLDLGAAMIKGGFAVSYGAYEADAREARDARRGIWASDFETPSAWRAKHPRR